MAKPCSLSNFTSTGTVNYSYLDRAVKGCNVNVMLNHSMARSSFPVRAINLSNGWLLSSSQHPEGQHGSLFG